MLLLIVFFGLVTPVLVTCAQNSPTVIIGNTHIIGKFLPSNHTRPKVEFFGGIPYALPPVGDLRLKPPVSKTKLDVKHFDASQFGPGCLQTPPQPSGVSEDCLTLTVFRPSGISSKDKVPVIAWLYGGGFIVGATSYYDPTNLVTRSAERGTPIIFVSINYRVGPLGFPSGNEAAAALRRGDNILNLGLHDQILGLQWIQRNIGPFGGDYRRVTIMGESAGASCISIHLQKKVIAGLARAAIIESPALVPIFNPERRDSDWKAWVSAVPGCSSSVSQNTTIECIRQANSTSLLQGLISAQVVFQTSAFQPVLDGSGPKALVSGRPSQLPANAANLPVLIGSNLDEGTIFIAQNTNSTDEIKNLVLAIISPPLPGISPEDVNKGLNKILQLYPDDPVLGSPFGTGKNLFGLNSQWKRLTAIFGDLLFTSGRRILTHRMSQEGGQVFAYLFNYPHAVVFDEFNPGPVAPGSLGVPHTSEIPFVFGSSGGNDAFSAIIQDYWISFTTSLTPNDGLGHKRLNWDTYRTDNQILMQLDGKNLSTLFDTFRSKPLAFWENNPDLLNR